MFVDMFQIVLGYEDNTISSIRASVNGGNQVQHSGPVLSCTERVPVWVSWDMGTIKVGLSEWPMVCCRSNDMYHVCIVCARQLVRA